MIFNKELFAKQINHKMFSSQLAAGKRLGLRDISIETGVSAPTLSRVLALKDMDMLTFTKILTWLGDAPGTYIIDNDLKEEGGKPKRDDTGIHYGGLSTGHIIDPHDY